MMNIDELKKQHLDTYKRAIVDNIKNNTKSLVYDDIKPLFEKPPLDSMDLIKNKLLGLTKKNKIVLNTEELDKILDKYRFSLSLCLKKIESLRVDVLVKKLDDFSFNEDDDIVVFYKKDFISINKDIKKIIKEQMSLSLNDVILSKINKIFSNDIDDEVIEQIVSELTKYVNGSYQKQLLESLEIKVLVKDTTLINGIKEQADHYLFTLHNSRLLNLD